MEEKRAETLQALSEFIQSQKALLARTQSDISRLEELRNQVVSQPDSHLHTTIENLADSDLRLSVLEDLVPPVPERVHWPLYASCGTTSLRSLALAAGEVRTQRTVPSLAQRSPLSPLQELVKDARTKLLDPALLQPIDPPSSDEEDPVETKKALERDKIYELKRNRLETETAAPLIKGSRRPRASAGVFVRRDLDDESAEVDIWDDIHDQRYRGQVATELRNTQMPAHDDASLISPILASPESVTPVSLIETPDKAVRERRPVRKAQTVVLEKKESKRKPSRIAEITEPSVNSEPPPVLLNAKGKPRPETYKQAWSVSEQHLLERLLVEIPEGEKNRWSKISRAMNGRRTARQVASRVQKYFEKLKRFGVEVGDKT